MSSRRSNIMSETFSSIEFTNKVTPAEAMEAVASEGAVAIHNFIPLNHLQRAARVLQYETMEMDDNAEGSKVDRHHELVQFGFSADHPWPIASGTKQFAPEPLFHAARKVSDFVTSASNWKPNEIMGHRYNPGDFIDKHRDYASALGYVAVLTLEGSQQFFFERDNEDVSRVEMEPGTLTIMRGYEPGAEKPRPYHWVAPALERRLAISLRQMRINW